jgi:diaminohydroxyphosphoribosylaminopyrimidine deaminase/5-amino-6-(5-phosphoribosylamino)uracil reductase
MKLAMSVAETNREITSPNPFVGAVLVRDGKIISTGYTIAYGKDHAEVSAIKNCSESTIDSDLYVTLEPCCHFGKTTPCTDAIITAGIKNVYIGITDPNPIVNGKGINILQNEGINVVTGILEKEITQQLEVYLHWIRYKKPFIILKNAVSLDAKIASANSSDKWITNSVSRKKVHELRHQSDAVLTTINTVIADNPILNVRLKNVKKHPIRIILDQKLQIELNSNICKTAILYKTIIFYSSNFKNQEKIKSLTDLHIEIIPVPLSSLNENHLDMNIILDILSKKKITSILIEAGTQLNSYLLENNLVNKIYYFLAPKILGGDKDVFYIDHAIPLNIQQIKTLKNDIMIVAKPI